MPIIIDGQEVPGPVYNSTPPTLTNGQEAPLQLDSSGNLKVNIITGGGGGSGNPAASATGSAVPASADYSGINVAGTLRGQTGVNPSGSIYAAQTDLSSVGGSSLALGQALAAASIPVVLTALQLAALTNITISNFPTIQPTSDAGPAQTTSFGLTGAPFTSSNQSSSATACTDVPTSGKSLVITDLVVSVDTAMTVTFTDSASNVVDVFYMSANSTLQITPRSVKKLHTVNSALWVQTSVSGHITVNAGFYSV